MSWERGGAGAISKCACQCCLWSGHEGLCLGAEGTFRGHAGAEQELWVLPGPAFCPWVLVPPWASATPAWCELGGVSWAGGGVSCVGQGGVEALWGP